MALQLDTLPLSPGSFLNVLAASTPREVLRRQLPPTCVIRDGKILARNQLQRVFER